MPNPESPTIEPEIVSEREVNRFISELAARIATDRRAGDVAACFCCVINGRLGVQKRWSLTVDKFEGAGATIQEALDEIDQLSAPSTLIAKAAELRKQADEMERSAAQRA